MARQKQSGKPTSGESLLATRPLIRTRGEGFIGLSVERPPERIGSSHLRGGTRGCLTGYRSLTRSTRQPPARFAVRYHLLRLKTGGYS
jgi:hypothetical protein